LQFNIEKAFNTKKICWAFQDEIRFFLLGCSDENIKECDNWQLIFNHILEKKPFCSNYVDLILPEYFFNNLTIRLGPLANESDKLILESIVTQYKRESNIKVENSSIRLK